MAFIKRIFPAVEPVVFVASMLLIFGFVLFVAIFTITAGGAFGTIQEWVANNFGWFYVMAATVFLGFVVWLMFSPFGKIRLGQDDDRPEFGNFSWFAMLFSAGMGIGLVFWSIAEPLSHFGTPPDPVTLERMAAQQAMRYTLFHWGLHPWAIYIVVGVSMAYFSYRHKLPLTIRAVFYPMLGSRIYGPIGHLIDTFSVVATLFGLTTSLGLGVMQMNTGLNVLTGLPVSGLNQILLIIGVSAIAIVSVATGVGKGMRILSEVNLGLALILLIFVGVVGPTDFMLNFWVQSIGDYLQHLPRLSFTTNAFRDKSWIQSWTIFYWAWWIAWAPFVGTFIARVSKGRTIREFVTGVLFLPVLVTTVWLCFFGGTALHMELFGGGGLLEAVQADMTTALYVTFDRLPIPFISKALATILIGFFFVTSSDSGTYVIDTFVSGGNLDPPVQQRITWGVIQAAVAALLVVAGGLDALQTASLAAALPFTLIMLFMCINLVQALIKDQAGEQVVKRKDQVDGV